MGRWTSWKKLAVKGEWYSWDEHIGQAACYEFGLGGQRRCSSPDIVYVGETGNLAQRLGVHASHAHDNLRKVIDSHLRRGFGLYFRAYYVSSRPVARRMQNNLLDEYEYDWNIQRNT
jgi:hypothetical protein